MKGSHLVWAMTTWAVTVITPFASWGWGNSGHRMIGSIAATYAPAGQEFWSANAETLGQLSNVPDAVWKQSKTAVLEKPTHFFEIDSYFRNPNDFKFFPASYDDTAKKFTLNFVDTHGTAAWRVQQFYHLALVALKNRDFVTTLQMVGVMSHYVGDLSQPLHVTEDYDGHAKGSGIHKFFETDNIQKSHEQTVIQHVETATQALVQDRAFQDENSGAVSEIVFREINRSFTYKDALLHIDESLGRSGKGAEQLRAMAEERLSDGAATLALLMGRLWTDAGSPNSRRTVKVSVPEWVAPDYTESQAKKGMYVLRLSHDDLGDDCY